MNFNWISISAGSATATNTPVPPTNTPVPPTNTPVPGEAPYGGTAWAMPGTVQVENYDTGGQNVGYSKPSAGTSGLSPAYRTDEVAQIEGAGDTGGGYDIGWNNTNDWYKYTVNVTSAGSYNLNVRAASPNTTSAYHVEVDGTSVTGSVTIPNTGGWQTYSTLTTTGVSLTAGQHILRLVVDNGGMNFNWISISVSGATATPTPTLIVAIDAGGAANGSYIADADFDSGTAYSDTSTSISTSSGLDSNPAPQGVYQTERWNTSFNYTIPGLTANASYTVRLHWAELSFQAAGMRKFNVAINGTSVLSAFDVYATAGYKQALSRSFTATANGSGQIVIAFTNGGADNPFISGIEILH